MKKTLLALAALAALQASPVLWAQKDTLKNASAQPADSLRQSQSADTARTSQLTDTTHIVVGLEDAIKIALSENVSVKVADLEIQRTKYAKTGTYAALYPKIDLSASYQRTLKKQVMYMDYGGSTQGLEVGRWNTWSGGVTATMPLINAQLWESMKISGIDVELAVEKARSSRIDAVTETKKAFFAVLLAKQVTNVYEEVYENALRNFNSTELKYKAQRASEMEYLRSKTNLSNAIPDLYNSQVSVILALWQLKAVIGLPLDSDLDVVGNLDDFATFLVQNEENISYDLSDNSTMRQLIYQTEELARTIKIKQNANIPTLSLAFNYTYNSYANDFNFSEYNWNPYSYVGLTLSIPVFQGGKRWADIRQAKNQYNQLVLQSEDTERQLKISIRNCVLTMDTNIKAYFSAQDAEQTAEKSYNIVEKSYEVGRSTITDLDDAQLALTQSRLSKSQAIYEYMIAKSTLEKILGAEWD